MRKISLTFLSLLLLPALTIAGQDRQLSMDECIELSRQNNPRVANAALSVTAAQAQRHEARASWFPTVSASAGGFKALDPMVSVGLDDVLGSSDAANTLRYYAETVAGLGAVGTEWTTLGQGYAAGLSLTQPLYAGGRIATGNALAAIKKLIYEEKKYTLAELLTALDADWEGYEDMRTDFIKAPKYGNNIEETDRLVVEVYQRCADACAENSTSYGRAAYGLHNRVL